MRQLFDAVGEGDLAAVQAAVAGGASVRAHRYTRDGETPLHDACFKGHLDIAQWLHSAGASIDATNSGGETPLHRACIGGHFAIAQWLHSAGACVDTINSVGQTPLHRASYTGHLDVAQWLHREGASVNATDDDGLAPLHNACIYCRLEMAQWLCSIGADATLKNSEGSTPAQLLQRRARTIQFDPQRLRSTLVCLVRRAQAQGPPPYTPLASVGAQN